MKLELVAGSRPHYWRIYADGESAGKVFINMIDEAPYGPHPSIQIFLNKAHQAKGIGPWAYRQACILSGYPKVYAHMRKSNLASQKAAAAAGFIVDPTPQRQLTMVWAKGSQSRSGR